MSLRIDESDPRRSRAVASGQNSKVSIVVVGAGVIGRKHVETIRQSTFWSLAGIVERGDAGRDYASGLGVAWHADAEVLLDKVRPDAAIIATPNDTHRAIALACIERRIPALVEKPIAGSLADAAAIVSASERAGVPVLVGHHRRHNPIIRRAKTLIGEGLLGRLTNVSVLYTFYKPPGYFDAAWRRRPGGGPVLINLIHEIDLVRHLCGEIENVQALVSNRARRFEVEDTAAVLLRLRNGALATLSLSDTAVAPWSWDLMAGEIAAFARSHVPVQTHFLSGTEGSLALPTLEHWRYPSERSWFLPLAREVFTVQPVDPFLEQLHHFYRVIRNGEAALIDGADGMATLRATLAILEAASTGQAIAFD